MRKRLVLIIPAAILVLAAWPAPAQAMHISEGLLPLNWAGLWFLIAAPFLLYGLHAIKRRQAADPKYMALVSLVGAAIFVISCTPFPLPAIGSCSHPCGTGLGAILIGPTATIVVASIALLLQAMFLSHGGLTTLGANIVSMGVVGSLAGYGIFRGLRSMGVPLIVATFAAGLLSDWATYAMTSLELATALHGSGSIWPMFAGCALMFAPTQIPLGVLEGFMTWGAYKFVMARRPELLGLEIPQPVLAEGKA